MIDLDKTKIKVDDELVASLFGKRYTVEWSPYLTDMVYDIVSGLPMNDDVGRVMTYLLYGMHWKQMAPEMGWSSYQDQAAVALRLARTALRASLAPLVKHLLDRTDVFIDRRTWSVKDALVLFGVKRTSFAYRIEQVQVPYKPRWPELVDYLLVDGVEQFDGYVKALESVHLGAGAWEVAGALVHAGSLDVQRGLVLSRQAYGYLIASIMSALGIAKRLPADRTVNVIRWPAMWVIRARVFDGEVSQEKLDAELGVFYGCQEQLFRAVISRKEGKLASDRWWSKSFAERTGG